jgi:hypothetical protein
MGSRYNRLREREHVGEHNRTACELGFVNTKQSGFSLENDGTIGEPKFDMLGGASSRWVRGRHRVR